MKKLILIIGVLICFLDHFVADALSIDGRYPGLLLNFAR